MIINLLTVKSWLDQMAMPCNMKTPLVPFHVNSTTTSQKVKKTQAKKVGPLRESNPGYRVDSRKNVISWQFMWY